MKDIYFCPFRGDDLLLWNYIEFSPKPATLINLPSVTGANLQYAAQAARYARVQRQRSHSTPDDQTT
jgi:hypothetical protein